MFTIHAYIAFTALGSLAFWLLAYRRHRTDVRARRATTPPALAQAA